MTDEKINRLKNVYMRRMGPKNCVLDTTSNVVYVELFFYQTLILLAKRVTDHLMWYTDGCVIKKSPKLVFKYRVHLKKPVSVNLGRRYTVLFINDRQLFSSKDTQASVRAGKLIHLLNVFSSSIRQQSLGELKSQEMKDTTTMVGKSLTL